MLKKTLSDTIKLNKYIKNFKKTKFENGIKNFCDWYLNKIKTI